MRAEPVPASGSPERGFVATAATFLLSGFPGAVQSVLMLAERIRRKHSTLAYGYWGQRKDTKQPADPIGGDKPLETTTK